MDNVHPSNLIASTNAVNAQESTFSDELTQESHLTEKTSTKCVINGILALHRLPHSGT